MTARRGGPTPSSQGPFLPRPLPMSNAALVGQYGAWWPFYSGPRPYRPGTEPGGHSLMMAAE